MSKVYLPAILAAILNFSKRSMIPARYHADPDSACLPLPKSAKSCCGGIFARLAMMAARLLPFYFISKVFSWSNNKNTEITIIFMHNVPTPPHPNPHPHPPHPTSPPYTHFSKHVNTFVNFKIAVYHRM